MKFTICLILLNVIVFISGELVDKQHFHEERRLAGDDYRRGWISIDCGNDEPYQSSGVTYSSDEQYIDTGNNGKIASNFVVSGLDNLVYNTLRWFPDGDRNCYSVKPWNTTVKNYLIRAKFMYGNYDGQNRPPIFDVYIGVNFWNKVDLSTSANKMFIEIVHKRTSDVIDICLVNIGQGRPLISALLLRPLNTSIYNSELGSLNMLARYNTGVFGPDYGAYVSDPDDIYDRLWNTLPIDNFTAWKLDSIAMPDLTNSISNDIYKLPPSIFKSEAQPLPGARSMTFFHSSTNPRALHYAYWHFAETRKLGKDQLREFNVYVNDNLIAGKIRPKYLQAFTIASSPTKLNQHSQIYFSINQTEASTLPPFLNAVEIYSVTEFLQSATDQDDVMAIMGFKTNYGSIRGWKGDPCLPVSPWNGLNCSSNGFDSPRITSLNLASRGLTGELLPSISFLTSLNYLNLSNNSLTGTIPGFLANMPSLRVMNLSNNSLTGTIPGFLANMPSLRVIDLSGNKLTGSVPVQLTDKVNSGLLFLSLGGNNLCNSTASTEKSKKHKLLAPVLVSTSLFVLLIAAAVFAIGKWKKRQGFTDENKSILSGKSQKRRFSRSELVNMTNNFQIVLGKGSFGTVYGGLQEDGIAVAVKILNHSSVLTVKSFQTEAELLTRVHHRNLVGLIGYCSEGAAVALIYEYMAKGNVREQLSGAQSNSPTLNWKERLQISIDAAQGLEYLHSGCKPAIVHRDMKTANILLDDKLQAKIADFGMSRIFSTESASHISTEQIAGTPGYLDPEFHVSCKFNEKSDVYSFGVILLELITGQTVLIRRGMDVIHIVNWVIPFVERGDINNIVDMRLDGQFDTNSAWRTLETAMGCVQPTGLRRPSMAIVLADLKECMALHLAYEHAIVGVHQEPNSSNNTFDGIHVDSDVIKGPSFR